MRRALENATPNWFILIQTLGIVFSLLLSGYAALREARSRKVSNYLQLIQFHRDVWKLTLDNPNLNRVRDNHADPIQNPLTAEESQFLSFLFLHITCTYELQKSNNMVEIERFEYDVGELLQFPLVKKFWTENKRYYNEAFVKFVDRSARSKFIR